MKVLLAHIEAVPGHRDWYRDLVQAAAPALEVRTFGVTLNPPGPRLSWAALDRAWRRRDRTLLEMYDRLLAAADACDVLFLYNGANVHPGLLPQLPTFNVYGCFDDPESSERLSRPVAAAFDAVLYGNIASRFQYEHWGCAKLAWIPNITPPLDVPPREERARILEGARDIDLVLCAERGSVWRRRRLELLTAAFPQALCFGRGWPQGQIPDAELHRLYARARIGWNLHNSTGPINRRLFALPAFGVLQICDNKTGLGRIFRLGEEVVGFDTIPEAIELTHYYLAHADEAREIARRGYERFWRDYHAAAIWERVRAQLEDWGAERKREPGRTPSLARSLPVRIGATAADVARIQVRRARKLVSSLQRALRTRPASPEPAFDDRFYRGERFESTWQSPAMREGQLAAACPQARGPLDLPEESALHWALTALVGGARRIVHLGTGSGIFADFAAVVAERRLDCVEEVDLARKRAMERCSHERVRFLASCEQLAGCYDLLVSVGGIEGVADVRAFLDACAQRAPRAIFATPNRLCVRDAGAAGSPRDGSQVRAYAPGELQRVLRLFYRCVRLFHLPDPYVPWLAPTTADVQGARIVAACSDPYPPRIELGADETVASDVGASRSKNP